MKKATFWQMTRCLVSSTLLAVLAIPILSITVINDAEAVPSFARKYDMSCNVCHTRQPRLNPYGQRFMENGYQLPGTADGGRKAKHLLGGETNGATLDDLSNLMAVRLRADIHKPSFEDNTVTETADDVDIVFPNVINIFIAGTVTDNISFFGEMEYATREGHEPALAFERAFMAFDNLGGPQVANVKVGVFDPSAMYSFPTHRQQMNPIPPEAHTDKFPPEINRIPLLPLAFSSKMFGLTRGPSFTEAIGVTGGVDTYEPEEQTDGLSILPFEPMFYNAPYQTSISVHGRPFGNSFLYQVGLAQNQTADDEPKTTFDTYVMVRYDMLGKFSNFQVSGFYYTADKAARAALRPPPPTPFGGTELVFAQEATDWTRMGIAARWQHKSWDIYGTYIADEIDKPVFGNAVLDMSVWETDGSGISIEADYLLTEKWLLGVRYDMMKPGGLSQLPPALQAGDPEINQNASFLGLLGKYYPRPNIGLYARYHHNLESSVKLPTAGFGGDEHPATNLTSMFTVGVDMAF